MILAQFELSQDLDFITKGLKARALFSTTRNSSLMYLAITIHSIISPVIIIH